MLHGDLYLTDQRTIRVECHRGGRTGEAVLSIGPTFSLFGTHAQLEEIRGAIDAYLHEVDRSNGLDRRDIVPAPADLFAPTAGIPTETWLPKEFPVDIASTYRGPHDRWSDDPTEAEIAAGRRNAPAEVP